MQQTPAKAIEVVLTAIELAARDVHVFTFERPDGGVLPAAEAGAHIGLYLPNGIERQYSLIAGGPAPICYQVAVKREEDSRGGSEFMHGSLRVGTVLKIDPPRNNFPLTEDAAKTVLIAGGIGITPILSMIRRLEELGRSWQLYYACRSRRNAAFCRELEEFPYVTYHFSDEQGGQRLDLSEIISGTPDDAHLYCCGPSEMLAAFEAAAKTAGKPPSHIHVEYFTQKYETATEGGFIVELAKSGQEVAVPEGKSILEVVRELGIDVPSSCEEGICGSCETKVISGQPDHRDAILTDAEREKSETMMICCSGCKSERLVLDL